MLQFNKSGESFVIEQGGRVDTFTEKEPTACLFAESATEFKLLRAGIVIRFHPGKAQLTMSQGGVNALLTRKPE